MDALEFLKERRRLCSCYEECISCPLKGVKCNINNFVTDEHYSKIIATVEKWSKEHPIKTRQSEFLKHYPNVRFFQAVSTPAQEMYSAILISTATSKLASHAKRSSGLRK